MLVLYQLTLMAIFWKSNFGQTENNTSEEYEYIDDIEKSRYNPVINVKVELPTSPPRDYEYVDEFETETNPKPQTITTTTLKSTTVSNCGQICELTPFDSISSLTSKASTKEMVILFRGNCFWIIDIKQKLNSSQSGREHPFLFQQIEASFGIPVSDNQFNVTAIFTSGLSSQSFLFKDLSSTELVKTIHPFPGLTANTNIPIDDTFFWFETKTLYFIQKRLYFAYDLPNNRQYSGFPRNLTDFGLNPKQTIDSVTVINKQIYLFIGNEFAIFSVDNQTKSGQFSGHLSPFMSIYKIFMKCPKISIGLRSFDGLVTNQTNTTEAGNKDDDDDEEEGKPLPTALILTLTLLFIFLVIASIILVFVLIRNNSIKRKLNKAEEPVVNPIQDVRQEEDTKNQDLKPKPKAIEDKELVNRISVYSSGKSVSTNAVINVKI